MSLTCPASGPHSANLCVSEEQPDCSDTLSAANSHLRILRSPILLSQQRKQLSYNKVMDRKI